MQDLFLAFIEEKTLFRRQDKVLLAISGGLDSVVMAKLFQHSPYSFGIAHVNFELRADESEEDARFVASLARELGVAYHSTRLPAASAADAQGISIQMAARDLRYAWFEKIRQQEGYDYIATAHHLNDLTETMLLNLSRGTGLAGLHGITARRNRLVRPLLFATRQELETYAQAQGLLWREDSSNSSLKYRRNKIRQQVVPILKELNPRLEQAFQETAHKVGAAERLLQHLVATLRQEVLREKDGHIYLSLSRLMQKQEPQYLLAALLEPYGGGWQEATVLLQSWQKAGDSGTASGKGVETVTHRIGLDRQQLIISPLKSSPIHEIKLEAADASVEVGAVQLQTRRLAANSYKISPDPAVATLDFHKLSFPLQVRTSLPGDWFQPLGMRGKKKLSDFMIDHKIPVNLKSEVLLVVSADAIVWVAGYRPDERFKIDAQTEEVFEIRLIKS